MGKAKQRHGETETAHRQLLRELEQEVARYRELCEELPVGLSETHPEGQVIFANRRWREIFGYAETDPLPHAREFYVDLEDRRRFRAELEREGVCQTDLQVRCRDGQVIWVRVRARVIRDAQGTVVKYRGIQEDVTQLRQHEEQLRASHALQRLQTEILKMQAPEDWHQIAGALHEELRQLIPFAGCGIAMVDLVRHSFYTYGLSSQGVHRGEGCAFLPRSLAEAMRTQKPVYRRNRREMEAWGDNVGPERNSVLDVPFAGGTLALNSAEENGFSERDIQLLARFTLVLSEAYNRLRRIQRQEILNQVRQAVWRMERVEDLRQVLKIMAGQLQRLEIPFDNQGVQIVNETSNPPAVKFYIYKIGAQDAWWELDSRERPEDAGVRAAVGLVLQFWKSGQIVYRPDLQAADPYQERQRLERPNPGIRSVVDVPFAQGTLAFNSRFPQAFSSEDLAFFQELAGVLSEGLRRQEDLRRLERQAQQAQALSEATAWVASTRTLDDVFQIVVRQAARLMSAARSTLFIFDQQEGMLVPRAQVGHDWEIYRTIRLRPGEDISGHVFATGEPYAYQGKSCDLSSSMPPHTMELFQKALQGPNIGGGAAVPLHLRGRIIGTLSVGSTVEVIDQSGLELLARLADQAVMAIERAQRLEDLERLAQVEQQLRHAQKMEAVGQLTAGIAHNFNNMLQSILLNLEMAQAESPVPLQEMLLEVQEVGLQAAEMIRQLMVFGHRQFVSRRVPVELGQVVQDTLDICRKTFDRKIEIRTQFPAPLPGVLGDSTQLQQALLNLCLNARDALEEGPQPRCLVQVRAFACVCTAEQVQNGATPGPYVCLQVGDNGPGMPPEIQARIFEPFFTTKGVGKGTGLGLSTVYGIIRDHQGWVACHSELGKGTTFSVYLPAIDPEPLADLPDLEPGFSLYRGTETLLVIEDEPHVRKTIVHLFRQLGYTVQEGEDGNKGLAIFRQAPQHVVLVLLDLSMPGLSGWEVLTALKEIDPQVKVVVCSGYAADQQHLAGAAAMLQKPVQAEELARVVRQVLEAEN